MARLIDADELCEQVWREALDTREKIEKLVLRQPTIDAESIIRCKNCEYYNGEDKYCVNDIFAKSNGYCMYGEEKDE